MSGVSRTRALISIVALSLTVAILLFVLRASTGDYRDLLNRAAAHADEGERTAAIGIYEDLTRRYPRRALPHLEMARVYLEWGKWPQALVALSEADRRAADPAAVGELRVRAYAEAAERDGEERPAQWARVIQHGERLHILDPDNLRVRELMAQAHLEMRRWSAAQSVYEGLLRAAPSDPLVRQNLGVLLLGHDASAIRHLTASDTELSRQLVAAADQVVQSDQAEDVHSAAGRVLIRYREWALAARHLALAVEQRPDNGEDLAYLGHALDRLGYRDEALSHLREAVEQSPNLVAAHTFLGLHHDRWGDTTAARSAYEAAYDRDPESAALCLEIGQTWAAERRYVAAEIWLREAVALRPDDPAVLKALARFYLDRHMTVRGHAVEATERLLKLTPEDADAHDLRGWAALQAGAHEVAELHLQRAIELDPSLASAHYHLGVLRSQQGRRSEAERAFVQALDLDTEGVLNPLISRLR